MFYYRDKTRVQMFYFLGKTVVTFSTYHVNTGTQLQHRHTEEHSLQ